MKYTNSNQWYQEYGKEVMDKNEFSEFEKYLNDRRQNGSHTLDEWEDLYYDFLKDSKKSMKKSIKSADDINNTAYFERVAGELHSWYVCYVEDYKRKYEYGFKNEKECMNWIKKNGFDLDPSMIESRKSAKKSIKESENFVNYIAVYDENGDCRGYVQNESPRLTQDVEKALHFKDEYEANKFCSILLKRKTFSSDELYVEGVYLNESKKSARKSIKESYEIPTNKNANWYTARFTDITIFKNNKVILENYYTDEKYIIDDKKFAEKISFYLYNDEKNGIFHWYEMDNEAEKWVNNRKFSKIYDNLENRK